MDLNEPVLLTPEGLEKLKQRQRFTEVGVPQPRWKLVTGLDDELARAASEFDTLAELRDAILVNPYDVSQTDEALHEALRERERAARARDTRAGCRQCRPR